MAEQPTPEEIQKQMELAKENCLFCKIVSGHIPSHVIFEDDLTIALLDIHPATNGHILLLPKEHYPLMPLVPDQTLGHLSVIASYMADLLKESFNADDVTVFAANGAAAGQQVQHFLYHVIPRFPNDDLSFSLPGSQDDEDVKELVAKLKSKLEAFNNSSK